jgi:hypothetical protein
MPIRFGSDEVMESMRNDPADQQPPPVSSPGAGRGLRRVLVAVAVVVGAFAIGWLYSTLIGCHSTCGLTSNPWVTGTVAAVLGLALRGQAGGG